MWIRLPNGRDELVVNEDHIARLLSEGGVEISDPRQKPEDASPLPVETDEESKQSILDANASEEDVTQRLPTSKKPSKRVPKSFKD